VWSGIQGGGGSGAFDIDSSSGAITLSRRLDREQTSNFEFAVAAGNDGFPDTTSSVTVVVNVDDENDNAPVVQFPTTADRLLVQLSRDTAIGTLITRIDASDPDDGLPAVFLITISMRVIILIIIFTFLSSQRPKRS